LVDWSANQKIKAYVSQIAVEQEANLTSTRLLIHQISVCVILAERQLWRRRVVGLVSKRC
jgi:hypothetical protein